jgi:hypothetical protein
LTGTITRLVEQIDAEGLQGFAEPKPRAGERIPSNAGRLYDAIEK